MSIVVGAPSGKGEAQTGNAGIRHWDNQAIDSSSAGGVKAVEAVEGLEACGSARVHMGLGQEAWACCGGRGIFGIG